MAREAHVRQGAEDNTVQRLSMALCPACERVNPLDAKFCNACGSPLVLRCPACATINVRTRLACHHCGAALAATPAPPSTDGPVVPVLHDDLPDAGWTLSLRADALVPPVPVAEPPPATPPEPPLVADADAPRRDAPPPGLSGGELTAAKARRRAVVRRAQQSEYKPAEEPQDALVLEYEPAARAAVVHLLETFGYRLHQAGSVAEAEGMTARRHHAVVLLGLGKEAEATAALCMRLHDTRRRRPTAVIAIGDARHHADRVRMQLAGADAVLLRPVGRGDLARALLACGLTLPRDPRLGASPPA